MDSRHTFKIAAIRARIEFCEAEHRQLLKLVTSSQVNIAWVTERMDRIEKDLRVLHRDLEAQEARSEEWN